MSMTFPTKPSATCVMKFWNLWFQVNPKYFIHRHNSIWCPLLRDTPCFPVQANKTNFLIATMNTKLNIMMLYWLLVHNQWINNTVIFTIFSCWKKLSALIWLWSHSHHLLCLDWLVCSWGLRCKHTIIQIYGKTQQILRLCLLILVIQTQHMQDTNIIGQMESP